MAVDGLQHEPPFCTSEFVLHAASTTAKVKTTFFTLAKVSYQNDDDVPFVHGLSSVQLTGVDLAIARRLTGTSIFMDSR